MTRDPRSEELLQQELDGANTPAESEELRRLLADDPALKADFERLSGLVRRLDAEEPEGPARALWPDVEAAIARERSAAPRQARPATPRLWWRPRLVGAFAAGLAVGVIALLVVVGVDLGDQRPYGSLGAEPPSSRVLAGSPRWIRGEGVTAKVSAVTAGDLTALTIDVTAGDELRAELSAQDGQALIGWQSNAGRVRVAPGDAAVDLAWTGADRVTLWFRHAAEDPGRLRLLVHLAGGTDTLLLGLPPGER